MSSWVLCKFLFSNSKYAPILFAACILAMLSVHRCSMTKTIVMHKITSAWLKLTLQQENVWYRSDLREQGGSSCRFQLGAWPKENKQKRHFPDFEELRFQSNVLKEVIAVNFHSIQSQLPSGLQWLHEDIVTGKEMHADKLLLLLLLIPVTQVSWALWWDVIDSCAKRGLRVVGAVRVMGEALDIGGHTGILQCRQLWTGIRQKRELWGDAWWYRSVTGLHGQLLNIHQVGLIIILLR